MPIICVGFFDIDIRPSNVFKWKWVYMSGRDHMDLNVRLMAQWFFQVRVRRVGQAGVPGGLAISVRYS